MANKKNHRRRGKDNKRRSENATHCGDSEQGAKGAARGRSGWKRIRSRQERRNGRTGSGINHVDRPSTNFHGTGCLIGKLRILPDIKQED